MTAAPLSAPGTEQALLALRTKPAAKPGADIDYAARDFEAVFLAQMFSYMSQGIETDPLFGGGHGEDMFRSLLNDEYAKKVAHNGPGLGLSPKIRAAMIEAQAKAQNPSQHGE